MKKITAIALLSIALISCKKETQTVTKVDPKTGKTITVEVPVEKTEDIPTVIPAIKDSLGVYTLKFKLEKGKTYPFTTYQREINSVTDPSGKSMNGTQETTDEMSFTVNSFDKGIYDISINLLGKRNSSSAQGKTIIVDTKAAAPQEPQLKNMWLVNKAFAGNKLNMKMDESGKVISIKGFETVYAKVNAAIAPIVKDAKERNAFVTSLKSSFGEKIIKEQFEKNIVILPAKGAKIGQSWTTSENLSTDGKLKLSTTYTLSKVENGFAIITVKGGIPRKSQSNTQQGITRSISMDGAQSGNIKIDANSGWVHHSNITMKTTQKESLSDGKQTQSMTQVSNSSVMINPSNK